MPLGQFDERIAFQFVARFTDATVPNTYDTFLSEAGATLRLDTMRIANSDNIPHNILFDLNDTNGDNVSLSALVPARAAYDGAPPYDVLAALMSTNQQFLLSVPGNTYQWAVGEFLNTGQQVVMFGQGGIF